MISLNPQFTTSANREITSINYVSILTKIVQNVKLQFIYVPHFLQKQYPYFTCQLQNTAKMNQTLLNIISIITNYNQYMSPVDFPLMVQQQKQEIHPPASETRNCVEFPKGKQKAPWNTVQNLKEK